MYILLITFFLSIYQIKIYESKEFKNLQWQYFIFGISTRAGKNWRSAKLHKILLHYVRVLVRWKMIHYSNITTVFKCWFLYDSEKIKKSLFKSSGDSIQLFSVLFLKKFNVDCRRKALDNDMCSSDVGINTHYQLIIVIIRFSM